MAFKREREKKGGNRQRKMLSVQRSFLICAWPTFLVFLSVFGFLFWLLTKKGLLRSSWSVTSISALWPLMPERQQCFTMGELAHLFLSSEFLVQQNVIQEKIIAALDTEDNSPQWETSVFVKFINHIIKGFHCDSFSPHGLVSATVVKQTSK